jgi:hypothetical protein
MVRLRPVGTGLMKGMLHANPLITMGFQKRFVVFFIPKITRICDFLAPGSVALPFFIGMRNPAPGKINGRKWERAFSVYKQIHHR